MVTALITAALTTFNLIYEDIPVAERRAVFYLLWNIMRDSVIPLLTPEQQKALLEAEKTILVIK